MEGHGPPSGHGETKAHTLHSVSNPKGALQKNIQGNSRWTHVPCMWVSKAGECTSMGISIAPSTVTCTIPNFVNEDRISCRDTSHFEQQAELSGAPQARLQHADRSPPCRFPSFQGS